MAQLAGDIAVAQDERRGAKDRLRSAVICLSNSDSVCSHHSIAGEYNFNPAGCMTVGSDEQSEAEIVEEARLQEGSRKDAEKKVSTAAASSSARESHN